MKLFFKLALLSFSLNTYSNYIFLFEYVDENSFSYQYIKKQMKEKYDFPNKYITWKKVKECKRNLNENVIVHFCIGSSDEFEVIYNNEKLVKKLTQGYIN
ncbi:MAG: hypothetical protein GY909_10490 [Oligoflexia bacterium]|nr:hypothetical protein [Oligoflexia bacterium]